MTSTRASSSRGQKRAGLADWPKLKRGPAFDDDVQQLGGSAPGGHGRIGGLPPGNRQPGQEEQQRGGLRGQPNDQSAPAPARITPALSQGERVARQCQHHQHVQAEEQEGKVVERIHAGGSGHGVDQRCTAQLGG